MTPRKLPVLSLAAAVAAFAIASIVAPAAASAKGEHHDDARPVSASAPHHSKGGADHRGAGPKDREKDGKHGSDGTDETDSDAAGASGTVSARAVSSTPGTSRPPVAARVAALTVGPAESAPEAAVAAPPVGAPVAAVPPAAVQQPAVPAPVPTPVLGGVLALPQGDLPGRPSTVIGMGAGAWEALAGLEGAVILVLAGVLWRRRSPAGRQ